MQKLKSTLYLLLKILCFIFIFFIFSRIKIGITAIPFATVFLFSLFHTKFKWYEFLPSFVIGSICADFGFESIVVSLSVASVALIEKMLIVFLNKEPKVWLSFIFCAFSLCGSVFLQVLSGVLVQNIIASVAVSLIFFYTSTRALSAIIKKGLSIKFVFDEWVGLFLFIMAFALGTNNLYIGRYSLTNTIMAFSILFVGSAYGLKSAIFFAAMSGFGVAFSSSSILSLGIYVTWAVGFAVSNRTNKYFSALLVLAADIILGLFFNAYIIYSWYNLLSVFIGCLLFAFIPKSVYLYFGKNKSLGKLEATNYIYNLTNEKTKSKLVMLANIFSEMQSYYQKLICGEMNYEEVKLVLAERVENKVCKNCPKYKNCYLSSKNIIKQAISETIRLGLAKKKILLVDIAPALSSCQKPSTLISFCNQVIEEFFEYEDVQKKEDAGKIVVGEQLFGASELIKKMAERSSTESRCDGDFEKKLINDFLYLDVIVSECAVFENENGYSNVVLMINGNYNKKNIEQVVSDYLAKKMRIVEEKSSKFMGQKLLVLSAAPKYDIVFGKATDKKTGSLASGDKFSFINLGDNRFMVALCDGMGSGEDAEKVGELATLLIEKYYRAGFDSVTALSSINRLLSFVGKDTFSAVDVCVIDANVGKIDVVKLGSTPTIIKSQNTSEIIECENLPLGIVESIKPTIEKRYLSSGDIIVLSSDGVYDSFGSKDEYLSRINEEKLINMTLFAENIKSEAEQKTNNIRNDDMTVVAVRIVESA